jgi:hypothetical protein
MNFQFCEILPLNKYIHQKREGGKIRAACMHMFGFPLGWRTPLDRPLLPLRGYGSTGRRWAEPRSPTPGSKCPSPPSSSVKVTLYRCLQTISLFSKELARTHTALKRRWMMSLCMWSYFYFYNKDDAKFCLIWYSVLEGLLADIFGIFFLLC